MFSRRGLPRALVPVHHGPSPGARPGWPLPAGWSHDRSAWRVPREWRMQREWQTPPSAGTAAGKERTDWSGSRVRVGGSCGICLQEDVHCDLECDTLLPQTVPNGHLPVCHYPTRCVELRSETTMVFTITQ